MTGARLSQEERVRIETLWRAGWSFPQIAEVLGRHRRTVWRELRRNNAAWHGVKESLRCPGRATWSGWAYRWGYRAPAHHGDGRAGRSGPRTDGPRLQTTMPRSIVR
jgi:hypothetical protein